MKRFLILWVTLIVSVFLFVASLCYNSRAEVFYQRMTRLEPCEQWVFKRFPRHLKDAKKSVPGDIIISTKHDTLSLVCKYPNQADIENRYPFYVFKDNHENVWSLFQYKKHLYVLYREDEEEFLLSSNDNIDQN